MFISFGFEDPEFFFLFHSKEEFSCICHSNYFASNIFIHIIRY
uniref:Uncharacterized protein n=1 Tax=Rhizophora mucronata TaxID=61149 RepID=A0A2P2Q0T7_RHIMU